MKVRLTALIFTLALGLLAAPVPVEAQKGGKVYRLGFLMPGFPSQASHNVEAFREGLRELGYVEDRSIVIEYRWGGGKAERLPGLATELVRLKPDVIVSASNAAIAALKQATQTIPIVMAAGGAPVRSGFIASFARPGGNITGLSNDSEDVSAKWLELLKEVVPNVSHVAVLWVPSTPAHSVIRREIERAAEVLGVTPLFLEAGGRDEIARAFAALSRERVGGLIVVPDAVTVAHRRLIVDLAAQKRLPGMYPFPMFVEEGGLMAYTPSLVDLFRRAATFVDKILKGANPANLPMEQPTKFELVLNMKTAKALGLTIPPSVLIRADQVIR